MVLNRVTVLTGQLLINFLKNLIGFLIKQKRYYIKLIVVNIYIDGF